MAAPTQKGTALEVGIGSYTYTGYYVGKATLKPTATVRSVEDEDGATATVLIINKGKELRLEDLVVKSGSDPTTIAIGDTITINSVNYRITDVDPVRTKGQEMIVSFTAVKEDSMSYA